MLGLSSQRLFQRAFPLKLFFYSTQSTLVWMLCMVGTANRSSTSITLERLRQVHQPSNFSCNKLNTYLGWPKWWKFDGWLRCRTNMYEIHQTQFICNMYNGLQCLPVKIDYTNLYYALGLEHKRFNIWNQVALQSKFPCRLKSRPLEPNSWVDPY